MTHVAARRCALAALGALVLGSACLAMSGCGGAPPTAQQTIERYSQKLREAVAKRVPQDDRTDGRRAQMLQVVDEIEALHRRFSRETEEFVATYRRLNVDYDSSRSAYDQLFADYRAQRVTARKQALDLHFRLASLADRDEWDAIGKAEAQLYEKASAARAAPEQAP